MTVVRVIRRLDLRATPAQVLSAWPQDRPLATLISGDDQPTAPPTSRWSVFASPSANADGGFQLPPSPDVDLNDPDRPPFIGGRIECRPYELGRRLEPKVVRTPGPADDRGWGEAQVVSLDCPAALVHDGQHGQWWIVGHAQAASSLPSLDALTRRVEPATFDLGEMRSLTGRDRFREQVARAVEYIHAGDVFQVNLSHRLSGPFHGSPRGLFAALLRRARPWYAAYLETPARVIASASPELFLSVDGATGRVTTRPMKGTRRAGADAAELRDSPKDSAELNMIIDLMRNDLSRVCRVGTVRVEQPRVIERHPQVLQATATISGVLSEGRCVADLLAAGFPPGSVTGAPKVRAMQIIEELEPVVRGAYCGAIGYVSDCGSSAFNVAIRTAVIHASYSAHARAALDYHAGAGMVADSNPEAEWEETLDKARAITGLVTKTEPSAQADGLLIANAPPTFPHSQRREQRA